MRTLRTSLVVALFAAGCQNQAPTGSTQSALATLPVSGDTAAVGGIYQLQAAFHQAKTNADIDLMMSLWADDAVFNNRGDKNSPYSGPTAIRAFWASSGSFTHRRLSLVPAYKTRIEVGGDGNGDNGDKGDKGDSAFLYFECHDVGDYDLSTRFIAGDTFLAGTVKKVEDRWVFSSMTAGKAFPLSASHEYFP